MGKNQALGAFICAVCVSVAIAHIVALFWPALEAIRLWLVAIPVLIAFIAISGIDAWIGWTMATASPPKQSKKCNPNKQKKARNFADN